MAVGPRKAALRTSYLLVFRVNSSNHVKPYPLPCRYTAVTPRSPFEKFLRFRRARARLSFHLRHRAASGRAWWATSLAVRVRALRPRAADWRTQERDFAKPHLHRKTHFTYTKLNSPKPSPSARVQPGFVCYLKLKKECSFTLTVLHTPQGSGSNLTHAHIPAGRTSKPPACSPHLYLAPISWSDGSR